MKTVVVGCGAWGTALAIRLCKNGHDVTMWSHKKTQADEINTLHRNSRLAGIPLPENLRASCDLACISGCPLVIMAVPSSPCGRFAGTLHLT